jgi:hypothetical protein
MASTSRDSKPAHNGVHGLLQSALPAAVPTVMAMFIPCSAASSLRLMLRAGSEPMAAVPVSGRQLLSTTSAVEIGIIVGAVCGGVLLVVLAVIGAVLLLRRRRHPAAAAAKLQAPPPLPQHVMNVCAPPLCTFWVGKMLVPSLGEQERRCAIPQ